MSAIPVIEEVVTQARPGAPRLRLVQPLQGADAMAATPAQRLKITRRGRLTLTLATATAVMVAVVTLWGLLPAAAGPEPMTVTVQPGQTLSALAAEHLPEVPQGLAVFQIQHANGLNSLDVQAGQELVIPQP